MNQESLQDGAGAHTAALQKVKLPAIFLIATAVIGALFALLGLVLNLLGTFHAASVWGRPMSREEEQIMAMFSGGMGIISALIGLIMAILIFIGALKMMRLESYGLAIAVSIIAMIPCVSPCCFMGLPFGIWALVVLCNNDVKTAFH